MNKLQHRYCIVGVGNTAYGQTPGQSQAALNVAAIRAALADAGLTTADLDGVLTKAPTSTFPRLWAPTIAEALRVKPNIVGTLDQAGATNIGLIQYAISCIELGQGEVVAIAYGDNPRTGTRDTYARARGGDGAVAGLFGAPSSYALVAQRRMHEYGTTKEQLAHVAITHRHHASMNPNAVFQKPITLDEYRASRWVAEPFGLLDCCPVSDGGAAYIVTTEARAKELKKAPIYIRGIGQSHPSWEFFRRPDMAASGAAESGRLCFASAGLSTADVDFCEIYDCFTIVPIITLEEYGFVPRGKGGALYQDGETRLGGRLPCNTSGGLLSETGTGKIARIVINRPEALNSMTQPMYADLSKAWIEVRDNPDIWVAVVTGAPQPHRTPERQVFTAGADLRSMNRDRDVHQYWQTQRDPILNRGLEVWKPIVAAVNGLCLAGGMTLLMATDIRIASEHAMFDLSEVKRGILPGNGGTHRTIRQLPYPIAMEMLLLARRLTAARAAHFGLINEVVPHDKVLEVAMERAHELASMAPLAVRAIKELAVRGQYMALNESLRMEHMMQDKLLSTEDGQEGSRAFVEKRKPDYKGR